MLRRIVIFTLVFSVFLLNGCDGPGVRAYHHGNHAYEYGNYKTAFPYYLYAANQGVVPAEYAVGYQYFYGQGVKRNEAEGIKWFTRAAPFSPRAQYALHLIHENTSAIPWTFQLKKPLEERRCVKLLNLIVRK